MKIVGAMSLPREKMLEFKADSFRKMALGVLRASKLNTTKMRGALNAFLVYNGIHPNDDSVLAWLQENPGPFVGIVILRLDDGRIDFRIAAGTQEELSLIGRETKDGEKSNNAQRVASFGEVNVGQGARVVRPGQV